MIDVGLPDGSGLDLIGPARARTPANQVIVMTGFSDLRVVLEALQKGAIDYLQKPFHLELLRSVLSRAVHRYQRWQELFNVENHV